MPQHRILITGTAGFIGFHLARHLLAEGFRVQGYDGMTDYYDVTLKQRRHAMLLQHPNFSAMEGMLEDQARFDALADAFQPEVIVHLAAQAGVRYSLENPRAYLDSNVIGTFTVMEAARRLGVPVGAPDEIACRAGWIDRDQLGARASLFRKTDYGRYLSALLG
jgi:UDP-glucuronate 4-epimerase